MNVEEIQELFHALRRAAEGFDKPYVKPSDEYLLAKLLFNYPARFADFYYMSNSMYVEALAAVADVERPVLARMDE